MDAIAIKVNKQIDGYTFSISPSIRGFIKNLFPNSYPANRIFVAYDTKSDFEFSFDRLENYIPQALLGVNNNELHELKEIDFIDTNTGEMLHKIINDKKV